MTTSVLVPPALLVEPHVQAVSPRDTARPFRPLQEHVVAAALSDPARRSILTLCIGGPRSAREIGEASRIPLASVYRHIKTLQDDRLLVVERSAISRDGKRYDVYRARLRSAQMDVTPDGVRFSWTVDEQVEERLQRVWMQLSA